MRELADNLLNNPVVIIFGSIFVLALLFFAFVEPHLPSSCKNCGWKGKKKQLFVSEDFEHCPKCNRPIT